MSSTGLDLTEVLYDLALRERPDRAVGAARDLLDAGWSLMAIAEGIVAAQRELGESWYRNEITVADEHAATAVADSVLGILEQRLHEHVAEEDASVLVVCPEGEWHMLTARIVALQLRARGLPARTLGASLPATHLQRFARERRVRALAFTCSTALSLPGASAGIDSAAELGLPVLVGGRAFGRDGARARALGASAWAATPADGVLPSVPAAPDGCRQRRVAAYHHRSWRRTELVEHTMTSLARRWSPFDRYTPWQVEQTRQDLDHIAHHAAISLLVDDVRLMDEFVEWLVGVLAVRNVPRDVVALSLELMASGADEELAERIRTSSARCAGATPT